ncbi:MAG TPA: hypothetical protein VF174_02785 [Micromonosporaceae bacterium]
MSRLALRGRWLDLAVALTYLLGAIWVTARGWRDVDGRLLGSRPNDQGFNEWMLAYAAHAVTNLESPFFTTLQNAPDGVNLMTNVGLQLPGVLLTPITLLGGASLSYLVLITANLAGTGLAWYWVLSRRLVRSRAAAFAGGLFCAFAPALVSHSNGHPHITAQWLVPFIVWRVVRLVQPGQMVRKGLALAALVAAQFFISVEILFLVALGCVFAAIGYFIFAPRAALRQAPAALAGLGVTAIVVLAVTAYPLWMQFFGPQHRIGHPGHPDLYALKIGSFVAYATESIGGSLTSAKGLTPNTTEEASFYGWPVVVLAAAVVVWLRRYLTVRVLALTAMISAILATGSTVTWGARRTDIPTPYALLQDLPIFDAVVVARFALITTAMLGVLFALAGDRLVTLAPQAIRAGVPLRLITGATAVAVFLPIMPTPLPAQGRAEVPHFVTSGAWREHVAEGRPLVPVPVDNMTSVYWGTAALAGFAVPQGYFLGPTSPTDDTGRWGVEPRPTARLLTEVAAGERGVAVSYAERAQAIADVRHWQADAVVLPKHRREAELRAVLDAFFGPGKRVDDVWVWNVRTITS